MAGERMKLEVKARDAGGSRASRRLRREGLVPGVLYGSGHEAQPFTVSERELRRVLGGGHGLHAILDVVLEGEQRPHHAVLKDYQLDPTRAKLLHVDLHEVRLDQPIHMQIAVELVGTAEGVARGGVLAQLLREVNVEALPMDVPDRVTLDVSALEIGDSARVADLTALSGVKVLDDAATLVASVMLPTRELPEEAVEGVPEAAEEPAEPESGE
jgi:large subunit ribosomal protein L25